MKLQAVLAHRRLASTLLVGVIGLVLTVPATIGFADQADVTNEFGARGTYRAQCRRLTKQIAHLEETVLPMAIDRGNRGWEQATNAQVERLWHRRADLCPEYGAQRTMLQKAADRTRRFNKLVATAGRAALAYFTGGLSGF